MAKSKSKSKRTSGSSAGAKSGARDVTQAELMRVASNGNDPFAVMFHAPWCHFCKEAMPEYKAAAESSDIPMLLVTDSEVPQGLGITGYPTIAVCNHPSGAGARDMTIGDSQCTRFTGARKRNRLGQFVREGVAPPE